jgi:NADPH:quinone reductase-like Zn-dependent oxidoreductase
MKGTVLYGPRDVRFEDREEPRIEKPTDAIIRISATCVCGSDLWPYRGIQKIDQPTPMGHEYCGIVEEVGSAVKTVKPGPIRDRVILYFRQYMPELQGRLPVWMPEARVHEQSSSADSSSPTRRRHSPAHAGGTI